MTYPGNYINLIPGSLEYNSNVLLVNYASASKWSTADLDHMKN